MLLHRLEREGVVEQVDVVHERDLLQPLARDVVPVRQPVDDEAVAAGLAQVERLDGDALDVVAVGVAAHLQRRVEPADQRLERARPVLLGARAAGPASACGRPCGSPSGDVRRSAAGGGRAGRARTASRAGRRAPTGPSRPAGPWPAHSAPKARVLSSAPVVSSHCPCPQTSSSDSRERSQSRCVAVGGRRRDSSGLLRWNDVAALAPPDGAAGRRRRTSTMRQREEVGAPQRDVGRVVGAEAAAGRPPCPGAPPQSPSTNGTTPSTTHRSYASCSRARSSSGRSLRYHEPPSHESTQ